MTTMVGENKLVDFQYNFEWYTANVNVYCADGRIAEVEIRFVKNYDGININPIPEEIEDIINEKLKEMM